MLRGFHFNDDHMLGDFSDRLKSYNYLEQLSIQYHMKVLLRLALMDNKSFNSAFSINVQKRITGSVGGKIKL